MPTLYQSFHETCHPTISLRMLQDLERFTLSYEVRDNNPLAFNTPLLAVHRAYWFPKDADYVFAIFGIDKNLFIQGIKNCPSVDKNFNVASNEFNILIIWLIYLLRHTSAISQTIRYNACIHLLKLLHYKFFCGKVAMQFQYGAKESVMQYTIDNLTAKSDIKNPETDTWKKLIQKHCVMTMEPGSIYQKVFNTFTDDQAVTKAVTDIHTRLCRKIVIIAEAYYENNKKGLGYGTSNIMTDDPETGGKVLADLAATLDIVVSRVNSAILNLNEFIDMGLVETAARLASSIRKDNVVDMLTLFSTVATQQVQKRETRLVVNDKQNTPVYVGYALLIEELIQKTFRRATLMLGKRANEDVLVLESTKNTYTASRVIDRDIGIIKNSVDVFMQKTKYTRQGTLVSLRVAFVLYIMMLAMKYRGNKNR